MCPQRHSYLEGRMTAMVAMRPLAEKTMPDNSELSRSLPRTVDELAALDWKTFETFATQTIRDYYAQFKVEILSTPFSHDSGRDGEGAYVLANHDILPGL